MLSNPKPLNDAAIRILEARHHDPFSYLGPQLQQDGSVIVRAMLPQAHSLRVELKDGGGSFEADLLHENGLFEARLPASAWQKPYEFEWQSSEGKIHRQGDAYAFGLCLGETGGPRRAW